ncbi:MAG: monovalent cation/H+ antiporter subunit E [Methanobacteriaceae archaeon]|nr:monovalent cation/H+ antiporter subunit E [Methanobacteriaceae archaeon]
MFLTRIIYGIEYFIVLVVEIIKAVLDTSKCSIEGNIDPVVIDIKTELKRPISQTILANSITLTPGTLTIDLDSENQILKVSALTPRSVEDIIPFEKNIKKMLE